MKIAYLIIAHNQPGHLHRMIRALSTSNTTFYIHVDAKSDMTLFKKYEYPSNVVFIDQRVLVSHGGFSTAAAMLNLMEAAFAGPENTYFQVLSGWDYPIKNKEVIFEYLDTHYPMNFINFYPLTGQADWVDFIRKYYFVDFIGQSPIPLQGPLKALQYIVTKLPFNRTFIPGMTPYRGSAWFCLNRATISYILDFLHSENGNNYYQFFEHSHCADEIMFHTIVLNSPHAESCRHYDRDIKKLMKNENNAYLHYIDWDKAREDPAILQIQDLDKLMQSEALFARKFNETRSKQVLDAIDRQIAAD
jgi:hypothetical protein